MSTNIHFFAHRSITVNKTGKVETQKIYVSPVWQTPSVATAEIIKCDNPIQGYVNWVLENFDRDQQTEVYADDDVFGEGEPVAFETRNEGREHVESFLKTVEKLIEDGWEIEAEAW